MFEEIKIGCSSSGSKYGTRLDTTIVKLEKKAIWSGLFTSNKFKSAPVEICLEKINKNISEPKILMINAGNANACLLYTSPSPRDSALSRMPSSA